MKSYQSTGNVGRAEMTTATKRRPEPSNRFGKPVTVLFADGTVAGYVSFQTTSIGASKLVGGPVVYGKLPKYGYCWQARQS